MRVALTLVIMTVAIVPPFVHFVTGPIGPGIGGFITGVPAYLLIASVFSGGLAVLIAVVTALWSAGLAMVAAWIAGSGEETSRGGD